MNKLEAQQNNKIISLNQNKLQESEALELFWYIQNSYSNFSFDDDKLAVWFDALQDTPFETLRKNVRYHVRNNRFPPTIAELIHGELAHKSVKEREEIEKEREREERWERLDLEAAAELEVRKLMGYGPPIKLDYWQQRSIMSAMSVIRAMVIDAERTIMRRGDYSVEELEKEANRCIRDFMRGEYYSERKIESAIKEYKQTRSVVKTLALKYAKIDM